MTLSIVELSNALDRETITSLTDDDNAGEPNQLVIAQASGAASDEIKALLGFPVDIDLANGHTNEIWITLTIERLFERRREATPQLWIERASRARAFLKEVRDGSNVSPPVFLKSPLSSTRSPEDRLSKPSALNRY